MNNNIRSTNIRIFFLLSFLLGNNEHNASCYAFTTTARITDQRFGNRQTTTSFAALKQHLLKDSRKKQSPISLQMSSEIRPNENNQKDDFEIATSEDNIATRSSSTNSNDFDVETTSKDSFVSSLWAFFFSNNNANNNNNQEETTTSSVYRKPPPLQIEDMNVLFYDVFLLLNLSMSISFWVTHRMDIQYLSASISEGSLFCLLWIIAGLYNGAFLYSAVDGHYGSTSDKGGPRAAGMLGLHTFINTCSLRIISALGMAVVEHRPVGSMPGEDLIPLEIAFGLMLMSIWRALHSSFTPRI
jgi:hypothetical protein